MEKDRCFGLSSRIACWKIDTPLENWLSFKAYEPDFWQKIYVFHYKTCNHKYYHDGVESILVQTDARDYKGRHFNTGVQIVGHKFPEWNEVLSLIHRIAACQEGSTLIAWDIAYSDKGWLMVEDNSLGSWGVLQSNKQVGRKAELFSYMDEYFETNELLKESKQ